MRSLILLFGVALITGCNPNPYCLNCGQSDGGADLAGGRPDLATVPDLAPGPDLTNMTGDGGCIPTNNGVEICDGIDNDCNGTIDDVAQSSLDKDPNNCGKCGNVCSYPNAFGVCTAGACSMGACQPGHYDIDKNPNNGCEYSCIPSNNGVEACDGVDNDCNGKIDDGFDLTSDPLNCGACGNACNFPNATGDCTNSVCGVKACNTGYKDLNNNPLDGCEYKCPVYPPVAEVCNGIDDDCNGQIDDNPTDVGGPCTSACPTPNPCVMAGNCSYPTSQCNGTCCGICTPGSLICAGGQKVCQAGTGPQLEVCNGKDDNCDGQIDEGFNLQTDPQNCGSCGSVCNLPNAVAGCGAGKCTIVACKPGFADLDKNPTNGCEYTCPVNPPTTESCNGKDDDCNGVVDDNLTQPSNFCNQTSICGGAHPVCCGSAGWLCNYPQVNGNIEVTNVTACQGNTMGGNLSLSEMLCDGFDGNCNTQIDESFPNKGKPCTVGVGACAGTATFVCASNKLSTICPATADPTKAVDETCNGLDDDCDGQIDERVPSGSPTCYNGGQHTCKGWVDPMVLVGGAYVYQYEASHPDATSTAGGTKTTRACSKPGVLPWATVTETQAAAACAAVKDSTGAPMRLCTAPEWTTACNVGVTTGQVWSEATNPTTYQSGVCNDANKNLGAPWATGSGPSCYAADANGHVYDMSGNVAEWTSTTVVSNGTTYYKVRGGAYNNFSGGTSCNFDFTIDQPSYQFTDVGFRCCSSNAP